MAASLDKNKPGPVKRDRKGEPRNAGRRQQSKDPIDEDSLVIKTFRYYQVELDGKHDKHERLVKLSRDVTIESKRIIFLLHRVTSGRAMDDVISEALTKINDITERCLKKIAIELEDEDPYMFLRAYTAGLQEYIEAVTFFHYLQTGKLMSLNEFQKSLTFTVDSKSEALISDYANDGEINLGQGKPHDPKIFPYVTNHVTEDEGEAQASGTGSPPRPWALNTNGDAGSQASNFGSLHFTKVDETNGAAASPNVGTHNPYLALDDTTQTRGY
ncbi:translin-associated protein X-like [Saccoglossus kowalevskii]